MCFIFSVTFLLFYSFIFLPSYVLIFLYIFFFRICNLYKKSNFEDSVLEKTNKHDDDTTSTPFDLLTFKQR